MAIRVRSERFIIDRHGKPTAVILSFLNYRKLIRLAEDRDDARALKQAVRTARTFVSHAELVERLKRQRAI